MPTLYFSQERLGVAVERLAKQHARVFQNLGQQSLPGLYRKADQVTAIQVQKVKRVENFRSEQDYYSVLFHELTHATGHESRLNRKGVSGSDGQWSSFGSAPYAREELVAEMGAVFLCGQAGIVERTIDNSAAYLRSWLRQLKEDRRLVVQAAAQAQKAADFVLGKQAVEESEGEP